jgi:hypothetical protein
MIEYTVEVYPSGCKYWLLNGQRHRTDGPAVEQANGTKAWYLNGQLHRTDGPAVELANGNKEWYLDGKVHRTDGPAVEQTSGDKQQWWYLEWWLDGKQITKQEHQAAMNPVEEMTMEEICKALGKTVKVKKWWNIL